MYRIRLHGRGGQGIKTASRILGNALFRCGYDVQDAPRYGAERRGAPMFAYVRAAKQPILERGIVVTPDLLVVCDESLIGVPAAGVMTGIAEHTVLLLVSNCDVGIWQRRLAIKNRIFTLKSVPNLDNDEIPEVSALVSGAAARLLGIIPKDSLMAAIQEETEIFGSHVVQGNLKNAENGYDAVAAGDGSVRLSETAKPAEYSAPDWIELNTETAARAAPNIHSALTSVKVRTGLWRTFRPVLDPALCGKCTWVCGSSCPDGVIAVNVNGYPDVDYDHCKGCMICVVQCPRHALSAVPERASSGKGHTS